MLRSEADVAIIGAGAAGLAAAKLLAQHSVRCVVLEATARIGGRIRSEHRQDWALPIELGAELVHGHPAPIWSLGGQALRLAQVPERRLIVGSAARRTENIWRRVVELLGPAANADAGESLAGFLGPRHLSAEDAELVRLVVEGYHAAPLDDADARSIGQDALASGATFEQFRPHSGYQALLETLEAGLPQARVTVELGVQVRRVEWRRGGVLVVGSRGGEEALLRARRCIVTCSIGVLAADPAAGGIEFRPYPRALLHALPQLAMGHAVKLVLRYRRAPWPRDESGWVPTFLHAPRADFPTLWLESRGEQQQVTAWVGGPRAPELSGLSRPELTTRALHSLATAAASTYSSCARDLLEAHCHDFTHDPLFRGAYSYVRPGGGGAARELSAPLADSLFFAGEALDLQYPGTVAGAIGSGQRAARKVLLAARPRVPLPPDALDSG